jgi:signal transduction histidine kinase
MEDPNGLTRTAVRTGEVRVIRDTLGVPNLNPRLSEAFRSMIVVPMKLGERVVGVFYLHDKDPHDFTEMETTLLVTLASQAASAIQNARLLGSLQRDVRTHAVFDNVLKNLAVQEPDQEKTFEGIGRGIQDMLGKDVSLSINMYDQETRRFGECHSYGPLGELLNAPPRAEGGTGAFVVDKGLSLYLENVVNPPDGLPTVRPEAIEHGVRSFAAIPVKRRDQIVGVLFINSQAALTFDDQTRGLLELMALQAGVAIEIARFHASAHFQGALVKAADLGFLAGGIAHEFRNRLQNMEIHVRELELLSPPENMRSALVERLRTEMGRAAHAISTFQSFTHQRDEVTTLDLDGLMAQAVDVSRQRARDHGITLRHERADVGMVRMNATWVQSIVLNLLRNAIDATEGATGGRREVEVTLTSKTPDALEIEVKDSGPGIPSEVLSNLFLPFHTTKGGTGGFGLGLFWVQRLVQRMKGRLRVVAHNEWGGATFGVSLPRAHATDEGVGDHGALRIDR